MHVLGRLHYRIQMVSGNGIDKQYTNDDLFFTDTPKGVIDNNEWTKNGKLIALGQLLINQYCLQGHWWLPWYSFSVVSYTVSCHTLLQVLCFSITNDHVYFSFQSYSQKCLNEFSYLLCIVCSYITNWLYAMLLLCWLSVSKLMRQNSFFTILICGLTTTVPVMLSYQLTW